VWILLDIVQIQWNLYLLPKNDGKTNSLERKRNRDDITGYGSTTDFVMSDPLTTSTPSTSLLWHEHMDNFPFDNLPLPMDTNSFEDFLFEEVRSHSANNDLNSFPRLPSAPGIVREEQNHSPNNDLKSFPRLKELLPKVAHVGSPICIVGSFHKGEEYNVRFQTPEKQEIHSCTRTCQDAEQLHYLMPHVLSPGKYRIFVDGFAFGLDLELL